MISTSSVALQKAQAYLNRLVVAGVTPTTAQRAALTALAKAIDGIGAAKFSAVYPFLGGTAAAHALDLMGAYDITWNGTVTHDANGITGDGSTGYGDTGISTNTFTYDNIALGAYVRSATSAGALVAGNNSGSFLFIYVGGGSHQFACGAVGSSITGSATSTGHFLGVGNTSTLDLYRNGSSIGQDATPVSATFGAEALRLLRTTTGTALFSPANLGLVHIGTALSAAELLTFYTAVQAFQTALARNV